MSKPNSLSRRAGGQWTVAEARTLLSSVTASGLTLYAFAHRHGIDPQRLYYWRRRIEGADAAPAFVEVHRANPGPVEVVARSGRVLRAADTIDSLTLRRLIAALEDDESC